MKTAIMVWLVVVIMIAETRITTQLTRIADNGNESANALSYMCEGIRIMKERDRIWHGDEDEDYLPPYDEWVQR